MNNADSAYFKFLQRIMRKVIGIGETVLDIIFQGNQPVSAVPGGSVFNALISLGRAGVYGTFISETGNDRVGNIITSFLEENGVSAANVNIYPDSKSPISLAFLNDKHDAEYIFYKDHPRDRLTFELPQIDEDDIVILGSYYAVNPVIRAQVTSLLEAARKVGAIIYYDVNYRSSHSSETIKLMSNILENFEYADIVRGSDEDFEVMFGLKDAEKVYRSQISFYSRNFIYTRGDKPLELFGAPNFRKQYPVDMVEAVSTIGAGDNFNAGILFGILKQGITRQMIVDGLTEEQWDAIIRYAQLFSANCCKSIYNYVDKDFGATLS